MSGTKLLSPAENFKVVTPSDEDTIKNAANETISTRMIMVDADGSVVCKNADGDSITLPMVAGHIYPIVTNQIMATGTSAIGIIALW